MRVAISSTILDLPQHRAIARDACLRRRFQPIMSDYSPLASGNAMQRSLEVVDSADAYIGIIGFRYGEVPPGGERSLTEYELERARERGIPTYVFAMDDRHQLELSQRDRDLTRVLDLRDRIKLSVGCDYFDSPEALHVLLVEALADLSYKLRGHSRIAGAVRIDSREEEYVAHPYTLVSASSVIGRSTDIEAFTAWCQQPPGHDPCLVVTALGGVGKSATMWKWFDEIVPQLGQFQGRVWWSFYEDSRGDAFVRSCLAYTTDASAAEIDRMSPDEREAKLIASLNERPYLIVIDGLERAMRLYANEEQAFVGREDLATQQEDLLLLGGGILAPSPTSRARARLRGTADPLLGGLLRRLASIKTSRIAVTTRLFPYDLQHETGRPIPGVASYQLTGLRDDEAVALWTSLVGNATDRDALVEFFNLVDNYPLFIRALACEVANYRRAPGNFSAWRAANPGFAPADHALVQRRSHVLEYALRGIGSAHFRVLEFLSRAPGSIGFTSFLDLLSPPAPLFAREYELIEALSSLEDRGLLGWDRDNDKYDMHPIVRAVVTNWASTLGRIRTPREYETGQRLKAFGRDADLVPGQATSLDSDRVEAITRQQPVVELRIVSGPGAGAAYRLDPGEHVIGRGAAATAPLEDPQMPLVAAVVVVAPSGSVEIHVPPEVYVAGSGHDVTLGGELVSTETLIWPVGALLAIRDVLLSVVKIENEAEASPAATTTETWVDFNRPPRIARPLAVAEFEIDGPPTPAAVYALRFGLVLSLPVILGISLAIFTKNPNYLSIGGLALPLEVGLLLGRRSPTARHRARLAAWRARSEQVNADLASAVSVERRERHWINPDPAELLSIATRDRTRLWERRRQDPDQLRLRVGTADLDSDTRLDDATRPSPIRHLIRDAPAVVSLHETGVVGIAGPADLPRRLAGWLVGQLAVLHSPADVKLYVLATDDAETNWRWATWLPHLRAAPNQDAYVSVGTDQETVAARVADLLQLLATRRQAAGSRSTIDGPDVVLVLDGAQALRAHAGVALLLREGPGFGIYAICLDSDARRLPEECGAVITPTSRYRLQVSQRTGTTTDVRADLVARSWCEEVARALALVRDVSYADQESALPQARLVDLLGLNPLTGEAIADRWQRAGSSVEAVVGTSLRGPQILDLRRDGPHGLIVGATGSGKSELLQTLIASLAVTNRPDLMTFVLVDNKGGSAFSMASALPHTVGVVTDLDYHLVDRILASLTAELDRREHLLASAGARDIEDYQRRQRNSGLPSLPRLVIAIDEFASMVRELPELVSGLMNITRRGWVHGLHLILATQRPAGVVSAEILANTTMRIAFRVTDPADSVSVIAVPDAAHISRTTPGRAYLRSGDDSPVLFQAAQVNSRGRTPAGLSTVTPWLDSVDWDALGRPVVRTSDSSAEPDAVDLEQIVDAVKAAARILGIPQAHRPWLAPLPEFLSADDLAPLVEPRDTSAAGLAAIPYGLEDRPAEQDSRVALLQLDRFGHLGIVGSAGTGRSQLLLTIAGMAAQQNSSEDVQMYGIDCGNHALRALTKLPHCGAVVSQVQFERIQRLLARLTDELRQRQRLLSDAGYSDIAEQRNSGPTQRLPHLLVFLDHWERFATSLGAAPTSDHPEAIYTLLREGKMVGIHLVITGDSTLLSSRAASLIEDKIIFQLAEPSDYRMAGISPRRRPESSLPGRALLAGSAIELQVAVLGTDATRPAQVEVLARIGAETARRDAGVPHGRRPFRVDEVPANLSFDDAWQLRADTRPRPLWGLVGVGGNDLHAVGPDLGDSVCSFLVAGPRKSGRSTALLSMASSFLAGGAEIVIATPRSSPLRRLAKNRGVRAVLTDQHLTQAELEPLLAGAEPAVLLIDDVDFFAEVSADGWLRELIRHGAQRQKALVVAGELDQLGRTYLGWLADLKRNGSGAVLSPQTILDGELIGARLPRSSIQYGQRPGWAIVHLGDGETIAVQVPELPD